jgi:hypothetical protein
VPPRQPQHQSPNAAGNPDREDQLHIHLTTNAITSPAMPTTQAIFKIKNARLDHGDVLSHIPRGRRPATPKCRFMFQLLICRRSEAIRLLIECGLKAKQK